MSEQQPVRKLEDVLLLHAINTLGGPKFAEQFVNLVRSKLRCRPGKAHERPPHEFARALRYAIALVRRIAVLDPGRFYRISFVADQFTSSLVGVRGSFEKDWSTFRTEARKA